MSISQEMIPASFSNIWRVAGWKDECAHAGRMCKVLGYESDGEGRDVVRVEFIDRTDLFEDGQAVFSPHMLLPAYDPGD